MWYDFNDDDNDDYKKDDYKLNDNNNIAITSVDDHDYIDTNNISDYNYASLVVFLCRYFS